MALAVGGGVRHVHPFDMLDQRAGRQRDVFAANRKCALIPAVKLKPESGPAGDRSTAKERWDAFKGVWGVVLLFTVVMGGIYTGIFTPTEAAGIGATGAFFIALVLRKLTVVGTYKILVSTAKTTSMLFFLIIGAVMFSNFVNVAGLPDELRDWVLSMNASPVLVVLALILVYLLLGTVLESLSMILLTVPIFYPMMQALGFDLIWFGILVVVVTEISLITPPVGLNVFVLKAVVPDVSLNTIFKGVTPFWIADIIRLLLIASIPAISLFLPSML